MSRPHPLLSLACLILICGPLCAGEGTPPNPPVPPEEPETTEERVISGEITELAERSFRIKPWRVKLPRRVTVTATSETRYYRQKEGRWKDVQVGELVLVVLKAPPKKKDDPADPESEKTENQPPQEASLPPETRIILRFWKPEKPGQNPEDARNCRVLLNGAMPFFIGESRGGVQKPGKRARLVLGIVQSLSPFTIQTASRTRQFRIHKDLFVVQTLPSRPDELKKGQNVLLRTATAPGADGTVQALLVSISPRPRLTLDQQRGLIQRERGEGRR